MQPSSETVNSVRRRVVVGVDGSKSSVEALHWADRLATARNAHIDAITAWYHPSSYGMSAWPVEWNPATDADAALQHTLRLAFGDRTPAGLTAVVREGHPANILVEASSGAELLVVGSRA